MYVKIGEITEEQRKHILSSIGEWKHKIGSLCDYFCAVENEHKMFIRVPPGGKVHRHADNLNNKIHTVLETNDDCLNLVYVDGVMQQHHLELRGVYSFDASYEHESLNNGSTDRIHMVETL